MAGSNTAFDEFIASEVKKYKGIYVPVKAGMLRRALIRQAPCSSLPCTASAWSVKAPNSTAKNR